MTKIITFAAVFACVVGFASFTQKSGAGSSVTDVTFNKDVAPIFFKNCAECHRPGESAPFSALTFKDARPWAKSIREKVLSREMPPWHADPQTGEWSNDRRLSPKEIETIKAWVDQGAKEGDPKALPPAPKFLDGWTIGKPDLVLTMPEEFTLEASGPDEYQYFEIETKFTEDKYVQMSEARPGNRKIVHHIIAFIQPPPKDGRPRPKLTKEEIEKMRQQAEKESIRYREGFLIRTKLDAPIHDDGCSLPGGGAGERRDGRARDEDFTLLAGYAPGMNQAIWEPGMVKKIPAGARIVLQMHYSKVAGSIQKDRSSVGLIFAKAPPQKELLTKGIANGYFLIPPGAERHRTTACWTVNEDIRIVTLMPHMHLRGIAMEYKAYYPDGRSEVLLNVPEYSFSWQTVYYAKKPIPIPKGTKIVVTGYFDNSTKNKFNPDPTKSVRWGEPTYDEMLIGWIDYTVDNKSLKPATALNK
ncbi:MAG: cytochrome c [Acidobacteria bacterium]|nr:cytochrome c [Acidobacteriota bacterium]